MESAAIKTLALLLCAVAPALAQNADPGRLRAIVTAEAQKVHVRAVEFGMWVGGREVLTMAQGTSMTTVPATTDMHFRIGGIGETFVSTLLLMLVEQGKLNLDDKISRWMPNLLAADQVTVRMLVANRAGYPDYVRNADFLKLTTNEPFRTITDDELIAYSTGAGKLNFPPGTKQQYSHSDNVILGQVIQRATGQTVGDLCQRYIFGPLGMTGTQYPTDQNVQEPVLHAFTSARGIYEDCTCYNPFWCSTPGMATSTLHDLGLWGPVLGTGKLLTKAHHDAQIAGTGNLYFAYGLVYANGWLAQNPSLNGYSGAFGYHLATGTTLVVETTRDEKADKDGQAFAILREVSKYVSPATPINF